MVKEVSSAAKGALTRAGKTRGIGQMMGMRFTSISALSATGARARSSQTCAACGMPMAASLSRLGSVRCHDCRDVDAPIRSSLPTDTTDPRELAHRSAAGVDVVLLWFEATGRIAVRVLDSSTGDRFEVAVKAADALSAFNHPFSYVTPRRTRAARAVDHGPAQAEAA
jgi:hypothetical protein